MNGMERSTEGDCCHNSQMDFVSLRKYLEGVASSQPEQSDEGCSTTFDASFDEEIQQATGSEMEQHCDRESTSPVCPLWNEELEAHIVANNSVQVNIESFTPTQSRNSISFSSKDSGFAVIGLSDKVSSKLSAAPSATSDVELNPVDSELWKRQNSEQMKELDKILEKAIPKSSESRGSKKNSSRIPPVPTPSKIAKERKFESKSSTASTSTMATDSSSVKKASKTKVEHFRMFGHGRRWTLVAVTFAWISCFTAVFSRMSTQFVDLKHPFIVAPLYQPVHSIGMIRMEICYNETIAQKTGCQVIRLSPEEVDDMMFNLSRALLTMAAGLGVALTFVLSTAVFWESINLRPVGFGFLLTYFFQSFSLLFFDTDLCHEYKCSMGPGSILCVVTSVLWIGTCISVAKMDSFKIKATRRRRRAARRKARQEKRALKEQQQREEATRRSESSGTMETDENSANCNGDLDTTLPDVEEGVIPGGEDTTDFDELIA